MADEDTTVLVVEDEPIIRMAAVDILEDAGFIVLEANSAPEALRLLRATPTVHVVFTDVHMPGEIDGLQLAQHVLEAHPGTGVVIVSGHLTVPPDKVPRGASFLPKPYRADSVLAHVRRARKAVA